jgi:predicted 3-demethylubiquinone-9 3-methyltransferase (glyoxalase superfamily)
MQKITTYLTFAERGEEAVNFYVALFKNAKINNIVRYGDGGPFPAGSLLNASFDLEGQQFMAMDAGPHFQFAEGISLFVDCKTQEEVDRLYDGLSEGGEKQPCGWVKDRFGVSWQIVPSVLGQLMGDPDRAKAQRVMEAMLKMHKMDIAALQRASDQG